MSSAWRGQRKGMMEQPHTRHGCDGLYISVSAVMRSLTAVRALWSRRNGEGAGRARAFEHIRLSTTPDHTWETGNRPCHISIPDWLSALPERCHTLVKEEEDK